MKRFIWSVLTALALLTGLSAHAVESSGTPTSATFTATTAEIPNQERGFYGFGTYVGSAMNLNDFAVGALSDSYNGGYRLVIGILDLSAYVNTDTIDSTFISNINAKFALVRAAHLKVIVRPVYNYSGSGVDTTVARITAHLVALRTLFRNNADVIAYFQDGFIGNYGEWYGSNTFGTPASGAGLRTIHQAIRANIHPRTIDQNRYPRIFNGWFATQLNAATAFSGSEQASTGIHNDCFLASPNDYTFTSSTLNPYTSNPERLRLAQESNWHPYGGETCQGFAPTAGQERESCSTLASDSGILYEGPLYHLTYLNHGYFADFITSWTNNGCYAQVMRMMGYRFQYDSISHQSTATAGQTLTFNVAMRNYGWSRIFSERRLQVRLYPTGTTTTPAASAMSYVDLRTLPPQATASSPIPVKGLVAPSSGTYDVMLCIPDVWATLQIPDYNARNANANSGGQSWNTATGCWKTGTTVVVP